MPYKSDAQRRYFNANRQQLEAAGVDVDEWNQSSKGMDLPEKAKKKKKQTEKQARVEPMPIWVSPPSSGRPLNPELVNSPGVQNLLKSLGMTSTDLLAKQARLITFKDLEDYKPGGKKYPGRTNEDIWREQAEKKAYTASTEACQECGAMHELGDDYCNRCGAYHSYGPDAEKKATLSELAKQAADISLVTAIDDENNLLLIRRSKDNSRSGAWESPLGHRDPGETDQQAAHRELKEETGLKAKLLPKTTTVMSPDGKKELRLFVGRVKGITPKVTLSPDEHDQHKWVQPHKLSTVNRTNKDIVKNTRKLFKENDMDIKVASIAELAKYAAQEAKKKDGDGDGKVNDGTDAEVSVKKQKSEAKKEQKHKARTKLGPIEHAYVADSVGAKSMENLGKKYQKMQLDPNNKYTDPYSQLLTMQGGFAQGLGERIGRGAARLAENKPWRLAAHFDPTAGEGGQAGLVGMLSGIGGGKDKAEGAKRRTAEAYAKFLKPHQDKLDPKAKGTDRETPWHLNMQSNFADSDSDIAGHKYMRKERPWNYWLNPLDATGPVHELGDRTFRRLIAGSAKPDSTAGRFGMGAGGLATLGLLPLLMGGSGAQNKLRASASAGGMYHDVAKPEIKKAHITIAELAKAAARHCDASPVVSEGEQAKREREKKTRTPQIEPASTF